MVIRKTLATKIKNAPQTPGVYIFKDQTGVILYVGKAINLRKRLLYYAKPREELYFKTAKFLEQAQRLEWIEVDSELESILLEMNLIRTLKPKYNIISKDDKRPLLVHITNDELPRVRTARVEIAGTGEYIGPFPSATNLKIILRRLRRIFPFCSCNLRRRHPCLFVDLGLCNPCPVIMYLQTNSGNIIEKTPQRGVSTDIKQYHHNINRLKLFLQGNIKSVQKQLAKEMKLYSMNQDYERAQQVKKQLEAIHMLLIQPPEIGHYLKDSTVEDHLRVKQIESLKRFINFPSLEGQAEGQGGFRIEGFDIANTSGTNPTAAMVVFEQGLPNTSEYRKFKITQIKGPNDPLMMKHVLERRLTHPEWQFPDLILIDGGKTQVAAAMKALKSYVNKGGVLLPSFTKEGQAVSPGWFPRLMGLAKKLEQLVIPTETGFEIISPPLDTPFLVLLRAVRDEAHRFGTTYHKLLRAKAMLKTT